MSPVLVRCRRATILLLVLIVVAMLTLASLSLLQRMSAEHRATRAAGQRLQASYICESGVEYVKGLLGESPDVLEADGGLYDNPNLFQGVLFQDDSVAAFRSRLSIVAPALSSDGQFSGIRFGLEDESARLNLNLVLAADALGAEAARNMLLPLPGMTPSIADAILDWLDADSTPRPLGAEREYYAALESPYEPDDGPIESLERLLLVREVTPALLFGGDLNQNFVEDAGEATPTSVSSTSSPRGWSAYLTLQSAEGDVRADGTPKIDVNGDDLRGLQTQLRDAVGEELANFIIAYRQSGPYTGGDVGSSAAAVNIDLNQPGQNQIGTLLDLVGARTTLATASSGGQNAASGPRGGPPAGGPPQTVLASPVTESPSSYQTYLGKMFDNLTTSANASIPGRLNINQAPRIVLEGMPGLSLSVVNQIIGTRDVEPRPERPERAHPTWLLADGLVTLAEMKQLLPLVTGHGNVWRAQCVGYYDSQGPVARREVLIDATSSPPRVLQQRDLSDLGPGFSPEQLGVEAVPGG